MISAQSLSGAVVQAHKNEAEPQGSVQVVEERGANRMNNGIDTGVASHAGAASTQQTQTIEVVSPESALADALGAGSSAAGSASEQARVTVSDVLQDPASTAHSFMQKAQACLERGDHSGYFAYHDHAMTWAQTEAAARNA